MHTADTRTNLVITLGCDGLYSPKSAASVALGMRFARHLGGQEEVR